MKILPVLVLLPGIAAAFLLSAVPSLHAQAGKPVRPRQVSRALLRDFRAIAPGSRPTAAQIQSLADDLTRLFVQTDPVPGATLNFLADKLARAAAAGVFREADLPTIALELPVILNGSTHVNKRQIAVVTSVLKAARIDPAELAAVETALRVLPGNFQSLYDGRSHGFGLPYVGEPWQPYRHASGTLYYRTEQGPVYKDGVVIDPNGQTHFLDLQILGCPLGKYRVSATIRPTGAVFDLGTVRVRRPPPLQGDSISLAADDDTDDPAAGADDDGTVATPTVGGSGVATTVVSGGGYGRFGSVTYSDAPNYPALPAGFSLVDIDHVSVTDAAGVTRFRASLEDEANILNSTVSSGPAWWRLTRCRRRAEA